MNAFHGDLRDMVTTNAGSATTLAFDFERVFARHQEPLAKVTEELVAVINDAAAAEEEDE